MIWTQKTNHLSYCEQNRCLSEAAVVAGCISSIDFECTCPSEAFKDTLGKCLEVSCTPDDLTGILSSPVPISNQPYEIRIVEDLG